MTKVIWALFIMVGVCVLILVIDWIFIDGTKPGTPPEPTLVELTNDALPHTYHMVVRMCHHDDWSKTNFHCGISPKIAGVKVTIMTDDGPVTWHTDASGAIDFGIVSYMGKPELQISGTSACPNPNTETFYWQNNNDLYIELVTTCQ